MMTAPRRPRWRGGRRFPIRTQALPVLKKALGCVEALTHWTRDRCRGNDLGAEVKARLRAEWGALGEWAYSAIIADCTGLDV